MVRAAIEFLFGLFAGIFILIVCGSIFGSIVAAIRAVSRPRANSINAAERNVGYMINWRQAVAGGKPKLLPDENKIAMVGARGIPTSDLESHDILSTHHRRTA
jgi:hypothetical protein